VLYVCVCCMCVCVCVCVCVFMSHNYQTNELSLDNNLTQPAHVIRATTYRLLELSPGQKIADQARQVLTACEKAPNDAHRIEYDPRNPFDICSITFTPIYKGSKFAEDPFTGVFLFGVVAAI